MQNQSWFDICLPKIAEIEPHLHVVSQQIKKLDGVKSIYVWGSYATNIHNPHYRVKDVDLIVKTSFFSEDLISITDKIVKEKFDEEKFLNEGYDANAILFSKEYTKLDNQNVDPWVISSDKKLLHWGPLFNDRQEADEIKKEVEKIASDYLKIKTSNIPQNKRNSWYSVYKKYWLNQFEGMPLGWYQSNEKNIGIIIKGAIKIA